MQLTDNFRYVRKRVIDLTPDEYRMCYSLNLRSKGMMQEVLSKERFRDNGKYAHAFMIFHGDRLVSWAIRFTERDHFWSVYVYTKTTYRRRGLGSLLLKEARRGLRVVAVHPWDERSASFYRKAPAAVLYNKGLVKI